MLIRERMIVQEIMNDLEISDFTYDKKNGIIKINENINENSKELFQITTLLKSYQVVFSLDKNKNIVLEE